MENGRSEVGRGWLLRVLGWDAEMQLPHACRERSIGGTGEEHIKLGEVVCRIYTGRKEVVRRQRLAVESAMVGS